MIQNIIDFYTNSGVVQFFFWFPVVFNMIFYPIHIWTKVQKDRKAVIENKNHYDFVTVGELFACFFLTVVPVLNALNLIFYSAPITWKYIVTKLDWFFGIQLVKDTRRAK